MPSNKKNEHIYKVDIASMFFNLINIHKKKTNFNRIMAEVGFLRVFCKIFMVYCFKLIYLKLEFFIENSVS